MEIGDGEEGIGIFIYLRFDGGYVFLRRRILYEGYCFRDCMPPNLIYIHLYLSVSIYT